MIPAGWGFRSVTRFVAPCADYTYKQMSADPGDRRMVSGISGPCTNTDDRLLGVCGFNVSVCVCVSLAVRSRQTALLAWPLWPRHLADSRVHCTGTSIQTPKKNHLTSLWRVFGVLAWSGLCRVVCRCGPVVFDARQMLIQCVNVSKKR